MEPGSGLTPDTMVTNLTAQRSQQRTMRLVPKIGKCVGEVLGYKGCRPRCKRNFDCIDCV